MASSGYDVYLKKCLLPVTPEKIVTKISSNNKVLNLINDGEINVLKKPGLTEIEFECLIPQVKYPFASYKSGFKKAKYFLDYFEKLKKNRKPFQFIVCRKLPNGKKLQNTNIKVSLEDYTITEDAKDGFDFRVKIKLKQWREYGTKKVKVTLASTKAKASVEPVRETVSSPAPVTNQTYTVVSGDCLWNIAKKFYGNGSQYTVIYNANQGVIGSSPNKIIPGQILTIPTV
jgi:hypothetical protein